MANNQTWQGNLCVEVSAMPALITIFGASGDLAKRKLLVALFNLFNRQLLHPDSRIIGVARSNFSQDEFQQQIKEHLLHNLPAVKDEKIITFCSMINYFHGDYDNDATYEELKELLKGYEDLSHFNYNQLYFMSLPSNIVNIVVPKLSKHNLTRCVEEDNTNSCHERKILRNVIIEKPFGHDLKSALELDNLLHKYLTEEQIYRIDHYLGKETVQNILMLRFANLIFEPIWNNQYIDSVQITVAETLGVENRANYFEKSGILRDMFQNHLLTILSLIAMESPFELNANATRDEMLKLIKSIRHFNKETLKTDIIRAQYSKNNSVIPAVKDYRNEENIDPHSTTETFVAMKLFVDNHRWHGVPFYLRSGKRLKEKRSEIVINFKRIKHSIFSPLKADDLQPNSLILRIQPHEGFALTLQAKEPGPKLCMGTLNMDFNYNDIIDKKTNFPDAYERLLLDCLLGDQTLFVRNDIIEESWNLFTPVLNYWQNVDSNKPQQNSKNDGMVTHSIADYYKKNGNVNRQNKLYHYSAFSWGPQEADNLIAKDHLPWHND